MLAEWREPIRQLVFDVIVRCTRDRDSTGVGQRLKTGGDVDGLAIDPLVVDEHVADIHTDAELETACFGE